jgi:hypothetical protein
LKSRGKADTDHTPRIPHLDLVKIFRLLAVLHKLMIVDKQGEEYANLLKELPVAYIDRYHELIQYGFIFTIALHWCRRAREGLAELTIEHLAKRFDEETKKWYWTKVIGEKTKNHQKDSQNLDFGGVILFDESVEGFNPGQFIEDIMAIRNPKNNKLFQKTKRVAKRFNLHNPEKQVKSFKSFKSCPKSHQVHMWIYNDLALQSDLV